jgi:alkyldihydroxyacetonephosphate synthase
VIAELEALPALSPGDVIAPAPARYGHDLWPVALKRGTGASPPVLVRPRSADAVAAVVRWAVAHGRRVAAYGAGTNVVGALDGRVDVVIGLERLDAIHELDVESQVVTVGAGLNGGELEDRLAEHGLTLGHYPQSLRISTVGGWVAMRASGTYSTGYGGVERILRGLEVVLPDGELVRVPTRVRPPGGLDLTALLTGSEGSLGIVTAVSLDVRRRTREESVCASFDTLAAGLAAQRELVQGGYRVALLRLYNAAESAAIVPEELRDAVRCLLMVRTAGPDELATAEARAVSALVERCGGTLLPDAAAAPWFARRFNAEGLMERANAEPGRMFDTIEVSVPWRTACGSASRRPRLRSAGSTCS